MLILLFRVYIRKNSGEGLLQGQVAVDRLKESNGSVKCNS